MSALVSPLDGVSLHLELDADEAQLLRQLVAEMRLLLDADIPRGDAVIGRLFPQAYDERDHQRSYEELVGDDLRAGKRRALELVRDTLGDDGGVRRTLRREEVEAWLTLLTDMRLAVGTRLEVTEEKMAAEVDPEDPEAAALSVLHWLGWLQESMLQYLDPMQGEDRWPS